MGLDLLVESCAKPEHEEEWRGILQRAFAAKDVTDAEAERFQAISIPSYERLGAPRVGYDAAADAWIIQTREARTPEDVVRVLQEFHGYHVVRLVESDGVPKYSHGGLYEGVDETSFRGSFLRDCDDVLSAALIDDAYEHKFPEEAVRYGQFLLAAADTAEGARPTPRSPPAKPGFLARLLRKSRLSHCRSKNSSRSYGRPAAGSYSGVSVGIRSGHGFDVGRLSADSLTASPFRPRQK